MNPAVIEEISVDQIINNYSFSPTLEKLSKSDNLFFLVAHTPSAIKNHLAVWKKATVIQFINEKEWIFYRVGEWKIGVSQERNIELMESTIGHLGDSNRLIQFDNFCYFDTDQTVRAVELLYNKFNLTDFNETHVRTLHQIWHDTILKIKLRNFSTVR